jgi:uncharacterized protein (DUF302 family)
MAPGKNSGLIDVPSTHSVDETVEKLKGILQANRITLFALIDHRGEAAKAGMENASHQATDCREPKGWHGRYARGAQ